MSGSPKTPKDARTDKRNPRPIGQEKDPPDMHELDLTTFPVNDPVPERVYHDPG
jgi:hypothetical protein